MSEHEFWIIGCEIANHNNGLASTEHLGRRRFRGLFGTTPNICSIIWQSLSDNGLHPPGAKPLLFIIMCFIIFKSYCTAEINKSITGLDEKTFRKWTWQYIKLIALDIDVVKYY